jgi:carbonic anhydrase
LCRTIELAVLDPLPTGAQFRKAPEEEGDNPSRQDHGPVRPHESASRQKELVSDQHPHAMILACADSRVPPEVVFDQGLGDLFTVRVAGNIVDDAVTASFEYGVEHLHTPLLVVMGHQSCGAVTAAAQGGDVPGTPADAGRRHSAIRRHSQSTARQSDRQRRQTQRRDGCQSASTLGTSLE